MKTLVGMVLGAAIVALIMNLPDIKRYARIRAM